MENVTKQWHKIMFAEDESPLGKPWQVTKQASQIHQASGLPREFAIFMELRDGARPVLYFSPIAAELCAELISSFEGAACSLPTDPMPSFTMAYGNAEEAWALVARDTPREERREAFDQHKSAQADTASKAQFIKIDPRDFIVSPFLHCPNCNQQEFGVLDIGRNRYTRRCRACWHTQYFDLPQITKKVIYLDQNAISNMMKALNPQTSAHQKGRVDPFWKTLFEKLDSLCKLQMIICPDSTAHSNESRVYTFFQALKRMYEQLSNGVSFYDPDTIRRFQVYEHLGNVLTGNPSAALKLDVRSVVSGELNEWTDNILITATSQWKPEWVGELRKSRDQLATEITAVFEQWRTDNDKTFNDWFEEEVGAFGTANLKQYVEFRTVLEEIFSGRRDPDPNINPLLPPPSAVLITTLVDRLRAAGITEENIWPTLVGYLTSPTLKEIPFLKISSMLWAAVARKAASGGIRPPSRGMSNDINTISTLLPYCDAMFIDKECWTYLNEGPLRTELNFGTKLFSLNNKQEFFEYLDAIRDSATPEHLATVRAVYGEDCPVPYTSIYRNR